MADSEQLTVSPVDGRAYATRKYVSPGAIDAAVHAADSAFQAWKNVPLLSRARVARKFADAFGAMKDDVAKEITWQMGRPVIYTGGEVNGLVERTLIMTDLAEKHLVDYEADTDKAGFRRFISREPLGVVLVIAPWNYPLLTAVNGVVPAILAGNSVILKHSFQTPLCAERFAEAFKAAGLPDNVFQFLHVSQGDMEGLIQHPLVKYVNFTGSVAVGRAVQQAVGLSKKFMGCGLELGGKDPAYVRPDCDLDYTVAQLVDGVYFNSGQSCCSIERIYVHSELYDEFVRKFVDLTMKYKLGDPTDPATTLGPVVRTQAADGIRAQIDDAVQLGAKLLIAKSLFPQDQPGTPYVAPQVLVDVTHDMKVMKEETFGPVVGIMKVKDDDDAIRLMNDSTYGLSASVWTKDDTAALRIGRQVDTGTFYMNRCDYLDPELAWVGVKASGRGCSLSKFAFDHLTRPKSFHLKLQTA